MKKINRYLRKSINYILFKLKSRKMLMPGSILNIETSTYCNLKCPLCPTGLGILKRARRNMNLDLYKKIIDENHKYFYGLNLHLYGEPFFNPDIFEMISYAKKKGLYVEMSTNGYLFKIKDYLEKIIKDYPDRLIISCDGITQDAYKKYRIGNIELEDILKGVDTIVRHKGYKNFINMQFIKMKHNINEIEEYKKYFSKYGDKVKIYIKTLDLFMLMTYYNEESHKKIVEKNKNIWLPKDSCNIRPNLKSNIEICTAVWDPLIVVSVDGHVTVCCWDPEFKLKFDILNENCDIKKIWNNEKLIKFRDNFFRQTDIPDICRKCPKY